MTLLEEGLILMILGIGFVLLFLCLMIVAMNIMSKVIAYLNTIFPEEVVAVKVKTANNSAEDEAVAIALALAKSRS